MKMFKYVSDGVKPTTKTQVFKHYKTYEGLISVKPKDYYKGDLAVYYRIEH